MEGEERREKIVNLLAESQNPVSGSELAKTMGVSRQVIVQDIALLRSGHAEIIATNRGYLIPPSQAADTSRVFKCRHTDEQTEDELSCIVDQGGTVVDVFVEHKIYGRIQGDMNIRCRRDVKEFMNGIHSGKSALLKNVTSDYHYHTISADNEMILNDIEKELAKRGYLVARKGD